MRRGIDAIDNDGLNCWKHNGNSNSPYTQPIFCDDCQMLYDDCPCDEEVFSDVKGKSFEEILKDEDRVNR